MKKLFLCAGVALCAFAAFSQGLENKLFSFNTDKSSYYYENGTYYIVGNSASRDADCDFTDADLSIDKDGWQFIDKDLSVYRLRVWDEESGEVIQDRYNHPLAIIGGNYIVCFSEGFYNERSLNEMLKWGNMLFFGVSYTEESERNIIAAIDTLHGDYSDEAYRSASNMPFAWGRIKNIDASSFYTERTKDGLIRYEASNLLFLFEGDTLGDYWRPYTFMRGTYWVPGKSNNASGIGEYLTVEFENPENGVVLVNGYADPVKRYLYKANNRIKTAHVQSLDSENPFEFDYQFEDYVTFSEIKFPSSAKKIRITIKEIYKGERWNDTVVTAALPVYNNE